MFKRMLKELNVATVVTDLATETDPSIVTERPPDKEMIARYSDYFDALYDKYQIDKQYMVGHSLGSLNALRISQTLPSDYFSGQVLLNPLF